MTELERVGVRRLTVVVPVSEIEDEKEFVLSFDNDFVREKLPVSVIVLISSESDRDLEKLTDHSFEKLSFEMVVEGVTE